MATLIVPTCALLVGIVWHLGQDMVWPVASAGIH